ncbi:hypothetical protein BaRGS_00001404 [Batillaria attramentaria]|uniref:Uncharacterized protein n=1 Tax=Batillaria attramentaria TaxID=370345 RepID=A0ABD0M686_9CAEN
MASVYELKVLETDWPPPVVWSGTSVSCACFKGIKYLQKHLVQAVECVSCCDYSYCNQEVPFNRSSALKLSKFTTVSTNSSATTSPSLWTVLLLLCFLPGPSRLSHISQLLAS